MPRLSADKRKQVGTTTDGCGAEVKVYQNIRGHLYTVCPNCGCDQRNGAEVQTRIFRAMTPLEGVAMKRPPNVLDHDAPIGASDAGAAAVPDAVPAQPKAPQGVQADDAATAVPPNEPIGAPVPDQVPDAAPIGDTTTKKPAGLIGLAILAAAAGIGLLFSNLGASRA